MTGPAPNWFGVGFNAQGMHDEPWAVIVDGFGNVTESKLHNQSPGIQLPLSVTLVSHIVENDLRTVVLTRPFKGATPDHYTFDPSNSQIGIIDAIGRMPQLSYHK